MPLHAKTALKESAQSALAHRGTALMLALVTFAVTAVTFLTVGRTAALEAEIASNVDAAGPRLIEVTVIEPAPGLTPDALERMNNVTGVEWILALGPASDVRSTALGDRANVAARTILGELPPLVSVEVGREPRPGEAIIGRNTQNKLQLLEPTGALLDRDAIRVIVGRFTSAGAVADLDRLVLTRSHPTEEPLATLLYALAEDAAYVPQIGEQLVALSGVPRENLAIESSPELIELGNVLNGTLGALSRQLALGAILVGMLLTALTTTLALNSRRRDFGRRRALGATRSGLVAITALEVSLPVFAGATAGTLVSLTVVYGTTGALPPMLTVASALTLIVLTGVTAAIPPAAIAATQDPLRILRVP